MFFASRPSPLGPITLYADNRALVALTWGAVPCGPLAPLLLEALDQLDAYFAGELRTFQLPLNPQGTDFQRAVWQLLPSIPFGKTSTYGALADTLGTSPRAIARACAVNPLPLLIPCHRVVGARGALGGYSGADGVATKAALLAHERSVSRQLSADSHVLALA